jgi:hypothetical protein
MFECPYNLYHWVFFTFYILHQIKEFLLCRLLPPSLIIFLPLFWEHISDQYLLLSDEVHRFLAFFFVYYNLLLLLLFIVVEMPIQWPRGLHRSCTGSRVRHVCPRLSMLSCPVQVEAL